MLADDCCGLVREFSRLGLRNKRKIKTSNFELNVMNLKYFCSFTLITPDRFLVNKIGPICCI